MTRRRSRLSPVLAVVVLLLAQLGASMHQSAVQHVRCGHGELVEATVVAKHSTDASRIVAVEQHGEAGDEHCVIATGIRGDARVTKPILTVHAVVVVQPIANVATRVVAQATLYRTAPKTSPPANA